MITLTQNSKLRSLRFLLPALLSLLAIGGGLLLYVMDVQIHDTRFEADFNRDQRLQAIRIQADVERWVQRNDMDMVQSIFAELGVNPNLKTSLFLDTTNTILAATRREYIGQPMDTGHLGLDKINPEALTTAIQTVRRTKRAIALFTNDRNGLVECLSTSLPLNQGDLEVHHGGVILVAYDLRLEKSDNLGHIQTEFLIYFFIILITALALSISLHFLITRRLERLKTAMMDFSIGKTVVQFPSMHGDEISDLVKRFNEMATTIGEEMDERQQTEEVLSRLNRELHESEARYRLLFEGSADGILIVDAETKTIKYANPALCQMLRYTAEELTTLGLADIHPEQGFQRILTEFESLVRGDKTLAPNIQCLRKDGSIVYADINSSNITIDGRKCAVGLFRDITERKRMEEKLRHSDQQFRLVWEKAADGMRLINEQGTVLMVNEAFCRFVEKEQSELVGKSFTAIYGQEQQEDFVRKHQERFKSRMLETHYERELFLWNGRRVWIEVTSSFLELEEQPTMLLSVFRDITERKQIEESLRQSEIKLQVIIESTADGILAIDSHGKVIKTNNRFAELWKIPPAILNSGEDATLLNFVLEQLVNPKQFLDKVQKLYNSTDEDSDTLFFKDGRIFERYSAPLILDDKIIGRVWSFRDITERKRAEEALRESKNIIQNIIDNSPSLIYILDLEGKFILANRKLAEVLNSPAEKLIGNTRQPFMSKEFAEQHRNNDLKIIASEQASIYEEEILELDVQHTYLTQKFPLFDSEGKIYAVGGISADITERKQAEEALRDSEQRYRRLIQTVNEGILVAQNGFLKFVNPMMQEITGFTQEELLTLPFVDFIYSEDREIVISNHLKRLNGEQFLPRYQFRIVKKDGSTRRIEMNGIIIEWEGQPATLNMLTDITERKQAEEALINSENQAHALLNALPDLMFRLDSQGVFLDYKAAKEDLAYQTESIIGLKLRDTLSPEFADLIEEKIRCGLQNGQMQEFEYQLQLPHKGICEFDARMVPSSPEEVIVIVRDVTERKKAEAEIKLINEQLVKLNAEKDKFFSIIAHDLRGPFSGFLGLTELMAEELSSLTMDEIQVISVNLRNSATNLFRLLENLLQWAKMQRGKIPFDPEVIRLLPIVDESIATLLENAKRKEIEITYDIPDNLEIFADSNILQTVIRNLVSNALKFTHKGGKISVSAKATENKSVEISVKDSGIGMSREMVDDLFRLDAKTNRKGTEDEPSTGLGLLLCKEFVEKHGGKIWVESEEGKGTTFYFTIT